VLAAIGLGAERAVAVAAADWPQLTTALCRSVAGGACTPQVYRSALYEAGLTAFTAVVVVLLMIALWRYSRRVQRGVRGTRSHARVALLVGRTIANPMPTGVIRPTAGIAVTADAPGDGSDIGTGRGARAVMLDDPRPAAYCVAGRPAAIVLTSGALAVLDQQQLAAVLAHERAHLAGRHHTLLLLARGLTAAFPGVPLFARGAAEIARLAEMAADDAAARANGRPAVIAALLALASPHAIPRPGLAAAVYAVPARVERLLCPPHPAVAIAFTAALTITLAALAIAPPLLATFTSR